MLNRFATQSYMLTPDGPLARLLVAALAAGLHFAGSAAADAFPQRPIRLLVPFAPGGGNDALARIVAVPLGDAVATQVVVDNRPGGGGIVANDIVAKSNADGHTLLLGYFGPLAVSPSLQKLPYDPLADFVALGFLASGYHILVAHPSLPARSVRELISYAKLNPGKLNSAFAGTGSAGHLTAELFRSVTGIELVHVPYRGSGPAAAAVMAGEAQMQFGSVSASMPFVRANRLIALATTSPRRLALAPEVPTLIESGISDVDARSWYALLAPSHTPQAIIDLLSQHLVRIVSTSVAREQFARQAIDVKPISAAEFRIFLQAEIIKWGRVARAAGIKPE